MTVFVAALAAEARPLIDTLKLKRKVDRPWPYYSNGEDQLLLTGIGQLNAATACAWLMGHCPLLARTPWINIGIAGHASHELGTLFWVERLQQADHGDLFPALHCRNPLAGAGLLTVDSPCTDYPEGSLVDMEGFSFYLSCSRFVPLELLHLLKVVSDNNKHPIEHIDKGMVSALIGDNCDDILSLSSRLSELAQNLPEAPPPELENCINDYLQEWRFSHSQSQQLQKLLHRYFALTQSLCHLDSFNDKPRDAKQLLLALNEEIEQLPVVMS